jgi:hypothetical protein
MKSLFKIVAASLGLAVIAAVSTPAMANNARVEIRVGNGYTAPPAYVEQRVVYGAPDRLYRVHDDGAWRRQQWREQEWRRQQWREHEWRRQQWLARERREHYWRERNQWRHHQWREQRGHDDGHRGGYSGGHRDGWRG